MSYCYHCMQGFPQEGEFCPLCGRSTRVSLKSHQLRPGTILNNKYVIGCVLGEGGFGITYVGRDTTLDIKVAVKEYFPSGYATRNMEASPKVVSVSEDRTAFFNKGKADFLLEARRIARFTDVDGIVSVRDFFEANGTAYIIMDYLDGETLSQHLNGGRRIPAMDVFRLMLPITQVLQRVHAEGIIHRDISPDNMMYLKSGKLVLMDFGSARYFTNRSKQMSMMLKQGFAPEEQYRKNGEQGPWTDVYSLCATMYRCITGVNPEDALDRLNNDPLKKPSQMGIAIPSACEDVLMYGLAVFKENRCQNARELSELMRRALENPGASPMAEQREETMLYGYIPDPRARQDVPEQNLTYGDSFRAQTPCPAPQKPEEPKKNSKTTALIIAVIAAAVLVVAAGVVAVMLLMQNNDTGSDASSRTASVYPTEAPTEKATEAPSDHPTEKPTEKPTEEPTEAPTEKPTEKPTDEPTEAPTEEPEPSPDDDTVADAESFSSASATSTLGSQKDSGGTWHSYGAENLLRNDDTCWSADGSGVGESVTLSLSGKQRVNGLSVINGYAGSEKQYVENSKPQRIRCTFSDGSEETIELSVLPKDQRSDIQQISFDSSHVTSYVKLTILSIDEGSEYEDTCITYVKPF